MTPSLPPHSTEAEQGLLSCCFLDPQEALAKALEVVTDDWFYDLRHRTIWQAIQHLNESGRPLDPIVITALLRERQSLASVGDVPYLSGIIDSAPSSGNLPSYIDILRDNFLKRKLLQLCQTTVTKVHEGQQEANDIINEFERESLLVREISTEARSNKDIVNSLLDDMIEEAKGPLPGTVTTGLGTWDHRFHGYRPGDLVVVAARPSVGKTQSLVQQVRHSIGHMPVGVFTLEMTDKQFLRRMAMAELGFSLHPSMIPDLMNNPARDQDRKRLFLTIQKLAKSQNLIVNDKSTLSIQQISSIARRWKKRHGIGLICVDYLQLIKGSSKRARDDRRLEIAEISSGLKRIAKDLRIVVLTAAQLNRSVEARGEGSRPRKSDLREAGEIEQDADVIEFLWHRESPMEQENPGQPKIIRSVDKYRDGPTGDVELVYLKDRGRFECVSPIQE